MGRDLAGENQVNADADTPCDLRDLLNQPDIVIAVVGATDHPGKYGGIIYRDLKRKGYEVYAVNPNRATVDGDVTFPSVAALPEKPAIVDFVVPPEVTLAVLQQCLETGLLHVWIQPGAEDQRVLAFLRSRPFTYIYDACIMVESRHRGG